MLFNEVSIRRSCFEFEKLIFFPTAKLRYSFEFKKEMLIFCGQWSFNSLIQCYRKGNFWKILWETSFFYSKRHSVPFHILRGSTTNHKFCLMLLLFSISHLQRFREMISKKCFCSVQKYVARSFWIQTRTYKKE